MKTVAYTISAFLFTCFVAVGQNQLAVVSMDDSWESTYETASYSETSPKNKVTKKALETSSNHTSTSQKVRIDFPSIEQSATISHKVNVPGATPGSSCNCSPAGSIEIGLTWRCYVNSNNTVVIEVFNQSKNYIDPADKRWNITLTK